METVFVAPLGLPAVQAQQLLFVLRSGDFQSTTDQAFTKMFSGTNYVISRVIAVRNTGAASVAATGGIYSAASKAGSALIGAAQSWLGLSGAGKMVDATLAAVLATDVQSATPLLSLTVGSTGAVTADVFIFGVVVS
jgi:hypothetical protein